MLYSLFAALLVLLAWGAAGGLVVGILASYVKSGPSKFVLWVCLWAALPAFLWFYFTEFREEDPKLSEVLWFMLSYQDNEAKDFTP